MASDGFGFFNLAVQFATIPPKPVTYFVHEELICLTIQPWLLLTSDRNVLFISLFYGKPEVIGNSSTRPKLVSTVVERPSCGVFLKCQPKPKIGQRNVHCTDISLMFLIKRLPCLCLCMRWFPFCCYMQMVTSDVLTHLTSNHLSLNLPAIIHIQGSRCTVTLSSLHLIVPEMLCRSVWFQEVFHMYFSQSVVWRHARMWNISLFGYTSAPCTASLVRKSGLSCDISVRFAQQPNAHSESPSIVKLALPGSISMAAASFLNYCTFLCNNNNSRNQEMNL